MSSECGYALLCPAAPRYNPNLSQGVAGILYVTCPLEYIGGRAGRSILVGGRAGRSILVGGRAGMVGTDSCL